MPSEMSWPVAPYEDVREIIRSKDRIAVADCICRVQQGLLEQACEDSGFPATIRYQPGYDHSYHFIATFIGEHIAYHAQALKA